MRTLLLALIGSVAALALLVGAGAAPAVESLASEARSGLEILNQVRQDPAAFSAEMRIDLAAVEIRSQLIWDSRLSASAQQKAEDMARRNYVGHFSPEGVGPGELARRHGYYLPLSWPDTSEYNYIESISAGSARTAREHIRSLIFDRGAAHSSPQANHRKHLLGMSKFWAGHVHVGMGFAYNPAAKHKGYFVVHTGVPGLPASVISGQLFAPGRAPATSDLSDIWVGAVDASATKFWTRVSVPRGQVSALFTVRVPQQSRVMMRYLRQRPLAVGYYTRIGTVFKRDQAEWIQVSDQNVAGIDLVISPR